MRNHSPLQFPSEEEIRLLRIIAKKRGVTATEAADMAGYDKGKQAAPLIQRLKRKGLIEAEEIERRGAVNYRVYLRITAEGKEALEIIDSGKPFEVVKAFKTTGAESRGRKNKRKSDI